jgi:two-component system, OmpR family, response regulator RegX3
MIELTVLVVDDETAWVGALGAVLGQAGYRIVPAYDGPQALRRFQTDAVDIVLLDLAMPGLDGAEVCRQIRAVSDVPIIIVSGERDRRVPAELLDLGADDFFRKGGPLAELLARMRAVARRRADQRPTRSDVAAAPLEVDHRRHEIRWHGRPIAFTAIEYRLLAALAERAGEVVDRADLLAAGWPDTADPDPLWLKSHLARLRDKLVVAGAPVPVAVRGVGYRLDLADT